MKAPYLYPNSEVLINKFDIKNESELKTLEADYSSSRLKDLIDAKFNASYTLELLLHFRFLIFQDIFYWAGEIRTINIEKPEPVLGGLSIEYTDVSLIF